MTHEDRETYGFWFGVFASVCFGAWQKSYFAGPFLFCLLVALDCIIGQIGMKDNYK